MRLASFSHRGRASYGIVVGDHLVDLGKLIGAQYPDLRALLTAGPGLLDQLRSQTATIPVDDVVFLPVIPNPDKIFCAGLNYRSHVEETGRTESEKPVIFLRLAASQVGHGQPMVCPKVSSQFDYEGELAVVIGKRGRHISRNNALDYIAGYSCYNDGSLRDWQRHTSQWTPGKNFAATGAFGPWLVTADEIPDPTRLSLATRLNGQTVQSATVDLLIFSIPEIIEYVSAWSELIPGDVIATGTPGGVGFKRNPPLLMKAGDTVEVEISGIGTLRNPIEAERD
ncbi:MAG: fumarylacetoacetate hydrolase family protein [Pseudolabrys sp.]|nr:fumarylacetoacetate hydrolase family protein [Pseudolabrys sp.]MDP2297076.1 fumarylacetoacetate hydrolase family protein [Pseudolabrys sp.]